MSGSVALGPPRAVPPVPPGPLTRHARAPEPQAWPHALAVGGVESLLEHVEVLGGRVLGPPNDMPWGQRVAHILDPDGNTVNLTEPL